MGTNHNIIWFVLILIHLLLEHYKLSRTLLYMYTPINVLIIEDDPSWQKIIKKSLEKWGCTVCVCGEIAKAIIMLDEFEFDIAVVDIYLGHDPSGLVLGKLIRQKYNKPFIFLTNNVDPKLMSEAILAKSSSYLSKPFTAESLFISIKNALTGFDGFSEQRHANQVEDANPFFFVKNGMHLKRIEWRDVVCLRSDRNYTKVITKSDGMFMIRCSLQKTLFNKIPPVIRSHFAQVNRGEAVQVNFIDGLTDHTITTQSMYLKVSEGYLKDLKQKLNIIM